MYKQKIEECARTLAAIVGATCSAVEYAFSDCLEVSFDSEGIRGAIGADTLEAFAAARSEADAINAVEVCKPFYAAAAGALERLAVCEAIAHSVNRCGMIEREAVAAAREANKAARAAVAALRAAVAGDHVEPPPPSGLSNRERRAAPMTKFGAAILDEGPRRLRFVLSGKVYDIRGEKAAHAVGRLLDAAPGEWVDFKDGDGRAPNVKAYFSPRQGKNGERVQGSDAENVGRMIEGGAGRGHPGAYRLRPL